MTEACSVAMQIPWPKRDNTGSAGYLLRNNDVKLDPETGAIVTAYNTLGKLCLRGPNIVKECLLNSSATAPSPDAEGFYRTGKIALCDRSSKKFYIVDGKIELVKVRGLQIAPTELEAVLVSHFGIAEVIVIDVKIVDDGGELSRAYVVRNPSVTVAEEQVKGFASKRLLKYERLEGGGELVERLQEGPIGKILKKSWRERAERETRHGMSDLELICTGCSGGGPLADGFLFEKIGIWRCGVVSRMSPVTRDEREL